MLLPFRLFATVQKSMALLIKRARTSGGPQGVAYKVRPAGLGDLLLRKRTTTDKTDSRLRPSGMTTFSPLSVIPGCQTARRVPLSRSVWPSAGCGLQGADRRVRPARCGPQGADRRVRTARCGPQGADRRARGSVVIKKRHNKNRFQTTTRRNNSNNGFQNPYRPIAPPLKEPGPLKTARVASPYFRSTVSVTKQDTLPAVGVPATV